MRKLCRRKYRVDVNIFIFIYHRPNQRKCSGGLKRGARIIKNLLKKAIKTPPSSMGNLGEFWGVNEFFKKNFRDEKF